MKMYYVFRGFDIVGKVSAADEHGAYNLARICYPQHGKFIRVEEFYHD